MAKMRPRKIIKATNLTLKKFYEYLPDDIYGVIEKGIAKDDQSGRS